jgi:hypothetical protein
MMIVVCSNLILSVFSEYVTQFCYQTFLSKGGDYVPRKSKHSLLKHNSKSMLQDQLNNKFETHQRVFDLREDCTANYLNHYNRKIY